MGGPQRLLLQLKVSSFYVFRSSQFLIELALNCSQRLQTFTSQNAKLPRFCWSVIRRPGCTDHYLPYNFTINVFTCFKLIGKNRASLTVVSIKPLWLYIT